MNITLDLVMQVHQAGIEFMEEAKRVLPTDLLSIGTFPNSTFIKLWISNSMVGRKTSVRKVLTVHTRWVIYLAHASTP